MALGIGIIGCGVMGADHARIVSASGGGARLVAVSDADAARAAAVAIESGAVRRYTEARMLIDDPEVEAVLIASPDGTHPVYTLACLDAGKPVLCEKPLAPTASECAAVIEAEVKLGRRLVQIGYMRRFDPAYAEMRAARLSGVLGRALLMHNAHRNASTPSHFTDLMSITNSAVHEFDIARFVLDDEIDRISIFRPKPAAHAKSADPLMLLCETAGGIVVDIELYLNASYGYDVRAELVCETGAISLASPVASHVRRAGAERWRYAADWRPRFAEAYRLQIQDWIASIRAGRPSTTAASAWDGYVASAIAEAGCTAFRTGHSAAVTFAPRPALYA